MKWFNGMEDEGDWQQKTMWLILRDVRILYIITIALLLWLLVLFFFFSYNASASLA